MMYKIHIEDRNYNTWTWHEIENMKDVTQEFNCNPIEKKLFTGDIVDNNCILKESIVREATNIPAIMIYGNKTYGRSNKGKFYYKCIPNDKRLPSFMVTYEQKDIGFNKKMVNKFVLFRFHKWEEKHPIGAINQIVGDINVLSNFYEYQLYCKNLYVSLSLFTKDTMRKLKQHSNELFIKTISSNNKSIENRIDNYKIFTIDPNSTGDLDDALSIDDEKISIYISNVPILLEHYNLWNSFTKRISTIYLPDQKRPMLPSVLSEVLCSLLQNESRIAFCIDIYYKDDKIIDIKYTNALIKVHKNFVYDEEELLKFTAYNILKDKLLELSKEYKYIKCINDSHDVIAFLMILMNHECAKYMVEKKIGIYRNLKFKDVVDSKVPDDIHDFIKIWQCSCGSYNTYDENNCHELIYGGLKKYTHITSPIRRLVDLLNMIKIQESLGFLNLSEDMNKFYNYWIDNLEYINTTMRAIRKIQIDCNILNMCVNNKTIIEKAYTGYVFDKVDRENKYSQYNVYLPELKIISRVNIKENYDDYQKKQFKIYLIEDEATLKRKIRLQMV